MIRIYDTRSRELIQHYDAHSKEISSLAIDKNSNYCVSVGKDCKVKVWDLRQGLNLSVVEGHNNFINSVKINDTEDGFLTCSDDLSIRQWGFDFKGVKILEQKENANTGNMALKNETFEISEKEKLIFETEKSRKSFSLETAVDGIVTQLNQLNLSIRAMESRITHNEEEVAKLTRLITDDIEKRNREDN